MSTGVSGTNQASYLMYLATYVTHPCPKGSMYLILKSPGHEIVLQLYVVPRIENWGDVFVYVHDAVFVYVHDAVFVYVHDAVFRHMDKFIFIKTLNLFQNFIFEFPCIISQYI
jgi:hypothetical protein